MATAFRAAARRSFSAKAGPYFPGISKIKYEGPTTRNPLAFAQYDANEVILGKTMKDWLRFSVCYWHTFRGCVFWGGLTRTWGGG